MHRGLQQEKCHVDAQEQGGAKMDAEAEMRRSRGIEQRSMQKRIIIILCNVCNVTDTIS